MRILIVTGSRNADQEACRTMILDFLHYGIMSFDEFYHGACPTGADAAIAEICADSGVKKVKPFPADWNEHGKSAGPIRNRKMIAAAIEDAKLVHMLAMPAHGEENKGTLDAIKVALSKGIDVSVRWVKAKP